METLDKAFGVPPDGRQLNERDYRICVFDTADRLLENKIDSAPLLAQVARAECSNHLALVQSFEAEQRGAPAARASTEKLRVSMVEEVTHYVVRKRTGFKP